MKIQKGGWVREWDGDGGTRPSARGGQRCLLRERPALIEKEAKGTYTRPLTSRGINSLLPEHESQGEASVGRGET